jgi:hypothetical protein
VGVKVFAYLRISTSDQDYGLEVQRSIGAAPQLDPAVVTRMRRLRSRSWSYDRIAALNADGVPTPNGRKFHGSTVNYAVNNRAA